MGRLHQSSPVPSLALCHVCALSERHGHHLVPSHSPALLPQVRDYAFDPDSGAISTLKFDVLGLPSIPQALLPCSALRWEEVVAVAPRRVVVCRWTPPMMMEAHACACDPPGLPCRVTAS